MGNYDSNAKQNYEIIGPSIEELRPSEEMKVKLQSLSYLEKSSLNLDWVVGEPCPFE